MPDPLPSTVQQWKSRVVATIDACIASNDIVNVAQLAAVLTPITRWTGCPDVAHIVGDGSDLSYRRIPLHDHVEGSYEALLIAWPPGHETPIHDHDGLWGIELILDGALNVEAFDLSFEASPQLVSRGSTILGIGDLAHFSAAGYAHRCHNLSSRCWTLSLHIYGGALDRYHSFHEEREQQWRSQMHKTSREPALV